jgi:hypothetical protein
MPMGGPFGFLTHHHAMLSSTSAIHSRMKARYISSKTHTPHALLRFHSPKIDKDIDLFVDCSYAKLPLNYISSEYGYFLVANT